MRRSAAAALALLAPAALGCDEQTLATIRATDSFGTRAASSAATREAPRSRAISSRLFSHVSGLLPHPTDPPVAVFDPPPSSPTPPSAPAPRPAPPAPAPPQRPAGVAPASIYGEIRPTRRSLDLAIDGPGFFVLGVPADRIFTRWGSFSFDEDGFLVSAEGRRVQGFAIDPETQQATDETIDVRVADASMPARATSQLRVSLDLDADAPLVPGGFDPSDPFSTSSHSLVVPVYDSLGRQQLLTMFVTQIRPGTWEWVVALPAHATSLAPAHPSDTHVVQGRGELHFDQSGDRIGASGTDVELEFADGAVAGQPLAIDFGPIGIGTGDPTRAYSVGDPTLSDSSTVSFEQDGYESGVLQSLRIAPDGHLIAQHSNFQTLPFARLALASFWNADALAWVGSSSWAATFAAGGPHYASAQTGLLGSIRSGALEVPREAIDVCASAAGGAQ